MDRTMDVEDLASDDRWNAGVNYAIERLCEVLSVDPKSISWDAATETVDGDVMSVICNVMVAAYGDEWSGQERDTAAIRAALTHLAPTEPSREGEDNEVERVAAAIWWESYGQYRASGKPWPEGVIGKSQEIFRRHARVAIAALATPSKPVSVTDEMVERATKAWGDWRGADQPMFERFRFIISAALSGGGDE